MGFSGLDFGPMFYPSDRLGRIRGALSFTDIRAERR